MTHHDDRNRPRGEDPQDRPEWAHQPYAERRSRLSSKGQVTIPMELREALGLAAGDTVVYELRDDTVVLRRQEPLDAAFHAAVSRTLEEEWSSPEDEEAFRDL